MCDRRAKGLTRHGFFPHGILLVTWCPITYRPRLSPCLAIVEFVGCGGWVDQIRAAVASSRFERRRLRRRSRSVSLEHAACVHARTSCKAVPAVLVLSKVLEIVLAST